MAYKSAIEWTDATWNPFHGCHKISAGCKNCYMFRDKTRYGQDPNTVVRSGDKTFYAPLKWKEPRLIFTCSWSDFFIEEADAWRDEDFAIMALTPQHVFQILTKRPERMLRYLTDPQTPSRIAKAIDGVLVDLDHKSAEKWKPIPDYPNYEASSHGRIRSPNGILSPVENKALGRDTVTLWRENEPKTWFIHALVLMAFKGLPADGQEARHRNGDKKDNRLANLIWGSRSDNQKDKVRHGSPGGKPKLTFEQVQQIRDARAKGEKQQSIADRLQISRSLVSMIENNVVWANPLAGQWPLSNCWLGVSVEDQSTADERIPLLLKTPAAVRFLSVEPLLEEIIFDAFTLFDDEKGIRLIDWVIVGGESGPNARPMHPDWVRSIRDQCQAAGVPFFFKQFGEWAPSSITRNFTREFKIFDDGSLMYKVGKKAAGRLLDGREWNEFPEVADA